MKFKTKMRVLNVCVDAGEFEEALVVSATEHAAETVHVNMVFEDGSTFEQVMLKAQLYADSREVLFEVSEAEIASEQPTSRHEDAPIGRRVHDLRRYTTSEAYDITQTDDKTKDGDILVVDDGKTVGFLSKAWPVALFGETGHFHRIEPGCEPSIFAEYAGLEYEATQVAALNDVSGRPLFKTTTLADG